MTDKTKCPLCGEAFLSGGAHGVTQCVSRSETLMRQAFAAPGLRETVGRLRVIVAESDALGALDAAYVIRKLGRWLQHEEGCAVMPQCKCGLRATIDQLRGPDKGEPRPEVPASNTD